MERITIENNMDFLRQVSTPVDFENDDVVRIISSLREYCTGHAVYAMAPVQIGMPKRLIYIKNTSSDMNNNFSKDYDESTVLVNPLIKEAKGHTRFLEGCESCTAGLDEQGMPIYMTGVVDRPYSVVVEYYDEEGNLHEEEFSGFKATVFMHEYDHLDGIFHIDRTDEILKLNLDEMGEYRGMHPQEVLDTDTAFDLTKTK